MILLVVFLAVVALLGMYTSQSRLQKIVDENVRKFDIVVDMQAAVQLSSLFLQQLVLRESPNRIYLNLELESKRRNYTHERAELLATPLSETEKEILATQDESFRKLTELTQEATSHLNNGRQEEARSIYFSKIDPLYTKLMQSLSQLYKLSEQSIEASTKKAGGDYTFAWSLTGVISTLAIFVAILIAIRVIRRADQLQRDRNSHLVEIQRANRELRYIADDLAVARDRAQQSDQAKSAFLANMSHELRTPLNAIIGYSEMLHEDALELPDSVFAHDLKKIHLSGRHLLSLINEILDLSQIEAGKTRLDPEQFPVELLVDEVVTTVGPLAEKNNSVIEVSCEESVGELVTDRTKLRQILINLLGNACKFTRNGTISLAIRSNNKTTQRKIFFVVEDSGIGMNKEQLGRVFEPFAQADDSTTRKYGGTGLGLTICKRFCEALGGSISVRSKTNKGSSFTVKIPADISEAGFEIPVTRDVYPEVSPRTQGELPPGVQERRKGLSTVLVIDDDPAAREMITRLCCREGFIARTANDGRAGVELAVELQPDVIILDIVMPEMDGWETLRRLREEKRLAETPVIITSMMENRELGITLGAFDFLTKPVDHAALRVAIKQCVRAQASEPILLVEENPELRMQLAHMLEKSGWTVKAVATTDEGIEVLKSGSTLLLIVDLATPDFEGYEIIEFVRKNSKFTGLPVVGMITRDQFSGRRNILEKLSVTTVYKYDLSASILDTIIRKLLERDVSQHSGSAASRIA